MDACTAETVAQRLRDLGFAEAHDDVPLDDLRRAAAVLFRQLWLAYQRYAVDRDWPPSALGIVGERMLRVREQVDRLLHDGYQHGQSVPLTTERARARLLRTLMRTAADTPAHWSALTADAHAADWQLPTAVVVMRAEGSPTVSLRQAAGSALVDETVVPVRVVTRAPDADRTVHHLTEGSTDVQVTASSPVPTTMAAQADRLADRAHRLVSLGILPRERVTWCAEHTAPLWLYAEPEIRHLLELDLLGPLFAEPPSFRLALAETMLAWLTSRDSAPVIAERLAVHPQTVRYRWRRLNELFGDQLRDPQFISMVTLLLRATLPLWRRGEETNTQDPAGT